MSPRPVAALWRLRPYLRPYRRQLAVMAAAAIAVEGAETAIPLVIRALIDGAVRCGDHREALALPEDVWSRVGKMRPARTSVTSERKVYMLPSGASGGFAAVRTGGYGGSAQGRGGTRRLLN